jgi:predicted P-loop ATPase
MAQLRKETVPVQETTTTGETISPVNLLNDNIPLPKIKKKQAVSKPKKEDEEIELPYIEIIEKYLNSKYVFRINVVTGRVEFKTLANGAFKQMQDREFNSIVRDMKKNNITVNTLDLKMLLNSDFSIKFDPFKNYLASIPKYDGETDYIKLLSETVTTSNNEFWEICLRKWLVAMVGSLIKEDVVNHTVIVFSGEQGLGKTSWINKLIPNILKDYVYSGLINPNNKDTSVFISECMVIIMDEFETMNKSDIGSLKELITKAIIRVRKAYGHFAENLIRRASFIASVNGKGFLNDTTGNRRFLAIDTIAMDYNHSINMDNVYSQALHLFKSGFQYWFDKDEINLINSNNEQFLESSLEEDLLLSHFEPSGKEDGGVFMMNTDIAIYLSTVSPLLVNSRSKKTIGSALAKHNFERSKKKGRYGYLVKYKKISSVLPNLNLLEEQVN